MWNPGMVQVISDQQLNIDLKTSTNSLPSFPHHDTKNRNQELCGRSDHLRCRSVPSKRVPSCEENHLLGREWGEDDDDFNDDGDLVVDRAEVVVEVDVDRDHNKDNDDENDNVFPLAK